MRPCHNKAKWNLKQCLYVFRKQELSPVELDYITQPEVKECRKTLSHLRHFYFQGVFDLKNGGDVFLGFAPRKAQLTYNLTRMKTQMCH